LDQKSSNGFSYIERGWLADHNEQQPATSQKRKAAEPGKTSQ
jgi:hypothetical protein